MQLTPGSYTRDHKTPAAPRRRATHNRLLQRALSHHNRPSAHSTQTRAHHPSKYLTMNNYNYNQVIALQAAVWNAPGVDPALRNPGMDQLEDDNDAVKGGAAAAIPNLVVAPFEAAQSIG